MTAVSEHVDLAISRARLYARVRYSERYRALTQNSSDLVTIMETSGIVRYQSPAIVRMLGSSGGTPREECFRLRAPRRLAEGEDGLRRGPE